jgi:hypothetical protein
VRDGGADAGQHSMQWANVGPGPTGYSGDIGIRFKLDVLGPEFLRTVEVVIFAGRAKRAG